MKVAVTRPISKLLPEPCPLGSKAPWKAGCYHHQWATSHVPYNNLHYAEPRLHYEISRVSGRSGLELGFHFEARDRNLNMFLLNGFRRHLFEIKDVLGEKVEAEMWDKGWTVVYEVYPLADYTPDYQKQVGQRMAEIIICLHPIFVALRQDVSRVYR